MYQQPQDRKHVASQQVYFIKISQSFQDKREGGRRDRALTDAKDDVHATFFTFLHFGRHAF